MPTYNLEITVTSKSGKEAVIQVSRSFTEWFDTKGHFVAKPFQELFASAVPIIGKVDPKRVKTPSHELPPELLDAVMGGLPTGKTTGAEETVTKKGGKRRKA